jgi:hypothetical protein
MIDIPKYSPALAISRNATHLGDFREGAKTQTQFLQDEFGNYDPDNGTYRKQKTLLNVKYKKEMCACFRVAIRGDEDGCERSVRMTPLNYTEKKILSKMETHKMIHTKIALVERTNCKSPRWMKDEHIPGTLYFNDTVDKIEGVGKIAKQRLNKNGIMTVGDLHGLHSNQRLIVEIARRM